MNNEMHNALWSVANAVNSLDELEFHLHIPSLSDQENTDRLLSNCGNKTSEIWASLMKLKELLYSEINISNKI